MNLINDQWIPVIREDGKRDRIAPWQIGEAHNPVIEIDAPRFDFQGALYQLLIGLIQTTFAPKDTGEWIEFWEDGIEEEALKKAFASVAETFELYQEEGVAFVVYTHKVERVIETKRNPRGSWRPTEFINKAFVFECRHNKFINVIVLS